MLQAISVPGGSTSKSSHQQQPTLCDSWCHCQIWSREDEVAQHLWHRCVQGDGDGNDEVGTKPYDGYGAIFFTTMIIFKVDPELLARAVVKLREITLTYTSLTMYIQLSPSK